MPFVFLIFALLGYAEIRIFLWVAGLIGLGYAMLLCIMAAVAGALLIRGAGVTALLRLRREMMTNKDLPVRAFFDAGCLAMAGLLLIIPGFLTDILGLALLIPSVRNELFTAVKNKGGPRRDPTVIEGEYTRLDDH